MTPRNFHHFYNDQGEETGCVEIMYYDPKLYPGEIWEEGWYWREDNDEPNGPFPTEFQASWDAAGYY